MIPLRSLILSASIAALAVFSNAVPTPTEFASIEPTPTAGHEPTSTATTEPNPGNPATPTDTCGLLSSINPTELKYQHVVDCYNAIPFDSAQATTTLATVLTLFKDYYVFTDAALARTAPEPFANAPYDIVGELERIGRSKYTSDYKFHRDILAAVTGLGDGHAAYSISCYESFFFTQDLSLYAPVVDGEQSVRVYLDSAKRGYEDCIVETINGENALSYLQAYARDIYGTSHDPNARLNFMLASQTYDTASGLFTDTPGDFSQRSTVPQGPYLDYRLKCANSTDTVKLREEWRILPQIETAFTDAASYVANVCIAPPEVVAPPAEGGLLRRRDEPVRRITKRAKPEPTPPSTGPQFPSADLLVIGNATIFYHLKDQPTIGVLVCHTFLPSDVEAEKNVILAGLTAFHVHNVTNILVDFQGNTGGSIDLSSFLVQMLFPNKGPLDAAFPSDMRVSKPMQELAKLSYNNSDYGYFNARDFINLSNGTAVYENNDLFDKPVTLNRNGRRNLWTEKTSLNFPPVAAKYMTAVASFPWTAKAENIRILTDGRCGSACGMASYFWTALHNVPAYAIGGTHGEDLSMFSFAGASVLKLSELQGFYKSANLTSPLTDLPYKNTITFSWLEMYGHGRTTPLEYDAELYRPKHRLGFTPENARSREVMWKEVAATAWK
ncbi:hypothetical protein BG015_003735 [Linnemannia schmuckeri]|uniref:CPAF-like PDZ domain-containing protein n=1 Tax=Linnemannia schmuckeri TaxID=64567 RepID=A0A9P5RHK3_9FUNG|nr:hypothetical protein BG015_003735 [Linnemannia schmuckeri]